MKHDPDLIFSMRESRSIPHMVSAGETVVVCGVWQDGTIQRYADTVGQTGHVVFIEANPDNVRDLSRITRGMDHVSWINRAVWSEKTELSFVRSLTNRHSWDRVIDDKVGGRFPYEKVSKHDRITIQADTIDSILSELGITRIDHLNLTVNRCEFEALEGAKGIISKSPGMRLRLPTREREVERMKQTVADLGFTVYCSQIPPEWLSNPNGKRYRIYGVNG